MNRDAQGTWIAPALCGVLLTATAMTGCGRGATKAAATDAAPAKVAVVDVKPGNGRPAVDVVGTLAAFDQVSVSSEVEGKVTRILADLGDRVSAGQPLVELDREKLQYRLDQQKATLDRAMAAYGVTNPDA